MHGGVFGHAADCFFIGPTSGFFFFLGMTRRLEPKTLGIMVLPHFEHLFFV